MKSFKILSVFLKNRKISKPPLKRQTFPIVLLVVILYLILEKIAEALDEREEEEALKVIKREKGFIMRKLYQDPELQQK